MKKSKYLFLLLFVVMISGCSQNDSGLIWDFASSNIDIKLVDENGHSLIDPYSLSGDKRLKSIEITWRGQTYKYEGLERRNQLRAVPEFYHGIVLKKNKSDFMISFGEFQPRYPDPEFITLEIPGIGKYKIKFINSVKTRGRNVKSKKKLWINDKENKSKNAFEIILQLNRKAWENGYKNNSNEDFLPITCYIESKRKGVIIDSDENPEKRMSIIYKGDTIPFSGYEDKMIDHSTENHLQFYGIKEFYTTDIRGKENNTLLAVGPFKAKKEIAKESFVLLIDKSKEYLLVFDCQLTPENNILYRPVSINGINVNNSLYFRNGPLFLIN